MGDDDNFDLVLWFYGLIRRQSFSIFQRFLQRVVQCSQPFPVDQTSAFGNENYLFEPQRGTDVLPQAQVASFGLALLGQIDRHDKSGQ